MLVCEVWSTASPQKVLPGGHLIDIISHVCSRWRQISLASSTLWTYMIFSGRSSIQQVEACLSRSKQAPLCVKYFEEDYAKEEVEQYIAKTLLAHAHRLCELHVSGFSDWDFCDFVRRLLCKPAPLLERLTLEDLPFTGYDRPCVIPGRMSSLRHLVLVGAEQDEAFVNVNPFHRLDTLVLKTVYIDATLREIVEALRNCSDLRFLSLVSLTFNEEDSDEEQQPPDTVQLKSLVHFSFGTEADSDDCDMVDLLKYISFPSTTSVNVTLRQRDHFQDLGKVSPSLRRIASAQSQLSLTLSDTDRNTALLTSPDGRLRMEWQWAGEFFPTVTLCPVALSPSGLRFTSLRSLTIVAHNLTHIGKGRRHSRIWTSIFWDIPASVTTLTLDLSTSLAEKCITAFGGGRRIKKLCANIKHLIVLHADEMVEKLSALGHCCRTRKRYGAPLREVEMIMHGDPLKEVEMIMHGPALKKTLVPAWKSMIEEAVEKVRYTDYDACKHKSADVNRTLAAIYAEFGLPPCAYESK
ncbi:hypothetical protein EVJ58_g9111 [Rhodofomes roseus]|uniref:F-box domain-containing protein n=1 Tax=Rhodofomes roseus TaxID=34475 RepID=A0A4Y9XX98_9APHY|nr:hypothetical protein EVJ58_g9111 [Rhodofomes roseus]